MKAAAPEQTQELARHLAREREANGHLSALVRWLIDQEGWAWSNDTNARVDECLIFWGTNPNE